MNTLTAEQLKKMRDTNEDFLLVNTLDAESFPKTEIPGSINIPQKQDGFADRVEQQAGDKQKNIVVYCASQQCDSSTKAAEKLEQAGFENVYDFEGGAADWEKSGEKLAAV